MLQHGVGREQGQEVANILQLFIGPLEQWLDQQIDRRLVRTFFLGLAAIVRLRHSRCGLLLSELGAHVLSPDRAPAGTTRLSNLLRSPKWSHILLERFLWYRADQGLAQLEDQGGRALAIWDESVLEKPESIALEGLCPVRSRDTLNKSGEDFLVVVGGVSRKSPASGAVSSDVPPYHFAPAAPLRPLTGPAVGPRTGLGPLRPRHPVS